MWNHSLINMPRKLFQGAYSSMRQDLYVCFKLGSFGRQWSWYLKWHSWYTFREVNFTNALWTRSRDGGARIQFKRVLSTLALRLLRSDRIGYSHFQLTLLKKWWSFVYHGGPNWPCWGSDDFCCLTGGPNWLSWGSDEVWCFMGGPNWPWGLSGTIRGSAHFSYQIRTF